MSGTSRTRKAGLPGTRVHKFGQIRFWTDRGLIVMVNEKTDEEKLIAPSEAKVRSAAFFREGQRMLEDPGKGGKDGKHYRDEAIDLLKMAKALRECYAECKAFGDPFDPEVAEREAELAREIKSYGNGTGSPKLITPDSPEFTAPPPFTRFLKV